jgi:hypothetical protein
VTFHDELFVTDFFLLSSNIYVNIFHKNINCRLKQLTMIRGDYSIAFSPRSVMIMQSDLQSTCFPIHSATPMGRRRRVRFASQLTVQTSIPRDYSKPLPPSMSPQLSSRTLRDPVGSIKRTTIQTVELEYQGKSANKLSVGEKVVGSRRRRRQAQRKLEYTEEEESFSPSCVRSIWLQSCMKQTSAVPYS